MKREARMKYFTKEWYLAMQNTVFFPELKVSKRAGEFSEAYYKELYAREEAKWLFEVSSPIPEDAVTAFDGFLKELLSSDYTSDMTPAEREELERELEEERKRALEAFAEVPELDPDEEKKNFKRIHRREIARIKETLPDEILNTVADVRVLALGYASPEVKKAISAFCRENRRRTERAISAYRKQFEKTFASDPGSFANGLDLHDCEAISCRRRGNDLVITVDSSEGFSDISELRLKNCAVIEREKPLAGAIFLYEEIYKTPDGYELHFLLSKGDLFYFTATAADVILTRDL